MRGMNNMKLMWACF